MKEVNDLRLIKKHYGENMMKFIRKYFTCFLDTPGLALNTLEGYFSHNKNLLNELIEQGQEMSFVKKVTGNEISTDYVIREGTPFELLDKAGYTLYKCETEEDIQSFKHYYAPKEEICTFHEHRLNKCDVFFAIKKNVDDIKREDFPNPKREDLYGTSVISIQFERGINKLSIKNRYNHKVSNPDFTFQNNLDHIIPGLTHAFNTAYSYDVQRDIPEFDPKGYVKGIDGRYYKYNYIINNVYYCVDNVIIDNSKIITKYSNNKERYIMVDYFIFDLKENKVIMYDETIQDPFINQFKNTTKITLFPSFNGNSKLLCINNPDGLVFIEVDNYGHLIYYKNDQITDLNDKFLYYDKTLQEMDVPNVIKINNDVLNNNTALKRLQLPNALKIGDNSFEKNIEMESIYAPQLIRINDNVLNKNLCLKELNLPELMFLGSNILFDNKFLKYIHTPKLQVMGGNNFTENVALKQVVMDELLSCGSSTFAMNDSIEKISFKKLKTIGSSFMPLNTKIKEVNLDSLTKVGASFLPKNLCLTELYLPNIQTAGNDFLAKNEMLESIYAPVLRTVDTNFLMANKKVKEINFENLTRVGIGFFKNNYEITNLNLSSLDLRYQRFLNELFMELINKQKKLCL